MKNLLPGLLLVILSVLSAMYLFPGISMKQLTVVTIPRGAHVFINGRPAGLSPLVKLVPDVNLHIAVSRDGFFPSDSLVHSVPDTLVLQLTQGAVLIVNTTPPECSVSTGNFTGVSPCSLVVMPGNPVEVTVTGETGTSVVRNVNILSPGTRVITVHVPWLFTDSLSSMDFAVIPADLLPFAMGPMTVGRNEVTAAEFTEFLNEMDPELLTDSTTLRGRTVLLDSIMKCNWNAPVGFNCDTTAYAPVEGMENHPVTGVTRQGAMMYCQWLSRVSGSGLEFRLPDSDEWSRLAQPGEMMLFNHSDVNETILTRNPGGDDGWARTAPSGALGYNPWGLGHMQGNVWEWVTEEGAAAGGSWISSCADCDDLSLIHLEETLGYPFTGFRVVAAGVPTNIMQSHGEER